VDVEDVVEPPPGERVTSADGTFRIDGYVGGAHYLSVTAAGYIPFRERVWFGDGGGLDVTLLPGVSLEAEVVTPDGSAVPGVMCVVTTKAERQRVSAGKDGRFKVDGLAPGPVTVLASNAERTWVCTENCDLHAGASVALVRMVVHAGAVLSGTITHPSGSVAAAATVLLWGRNLVHPLVTKTDPSGRYSFVAGLEGAYFVGVGYSESVDLALAGQGVEVSAGENVLDVTVPEGFACTGTVVDETGRLVPFASIRVKFAGQLQTPRPMIEDGTPVFAADKDGRFALMRLPPKPFALLCYDRQGRVGTLQVTPEMVGRTEALAIQVRPKE
jgi:hypothetical protein